MRSDKKKQALSSSAFLGALTSVACMGSMGAMGVAATATAGMAGMSGATVGATRVAPITALLQNAGLGALTQIPDAVLRPIFILLLLIGIVGAYFAYRAHGQIGPFLVTVLASALLYSSIYVAPSDPFYYVSFALLIAGALWSMLVRSGRGARRVKTP